VSTEMSEETDRELDKRIAEQVFGIKKIFRPCDTKTGEDYFSPKEYHYIPSGKPPRTHMIDARVVPYFASDISAAMEVEDRIAELGLTGRYVDAIVDVVGGVQSTLWPIVHATAKQRSLAALKAIESK